MPTPAHAHPTRSILALGLALALALALFSACGNPPTTNPPPGGTGPVTATIDRHGGSLEASSDDGARLRLTIPPNATAEPIDITLTPLEPGTTVARFELQPFGLRLRLPAEFHMTLPDTPPAGATLYFSADGTRIPTDTRLGGDDRTLVATTPQLGYPSTSLGRSHLQPLQDAEDTAGQVEIDPIACADAILALNRARKPDRDGYLFTITEAEALLDARLVVLAACTSADDLDAAQAEIELLQEAACERYRDARTDALTLYTPALGADIDDLWPYAEAAVAHAATIEFTGATCTNPPDLVALVDELLDRYADAYPTRLQGLDTDIWRAVWAIELLNLDRLVSAAALFGLPAATQERMRDLAGDLLDALHPHALQRCRDDFSQGYLADILNGGGHIGRDVWPIPDTFRGSITTDDLRGDIQRCADAITITVFDDLAEPIGVLDLNTIASDLREPPTVTLVPSGDGAVQLTGRLSAFRCHVYRQTPQLGDDVVVLTVGTSEIERWNHTNGNYLAQTRDLSVSVIRQAAGLPATFEGVIRLELHRVGTACNGAYGEESTLLYVLNIVVGVPTTSDPPAPVTGGSCVAGVDIAYTRIDGVTAFAELEFDIEELQPSPEGDDEDLLFDSTVSHEGSAPILHPGGFELGEARAAGTASTRCDVFRDPLLGVTGATIVASVDTKASREANQGVVSARSVTSMVIDFALPAGGAYVLSGTVGPSYEVRLRGPSSQDVVHLQPTTGEPRVLDASGILVGGTGYRLTVSSNRTIVNQNTSLSDAVDLSFTIEPPTP